MRLLVDTVTFLRAAREPELLSKRAHTALAEANNLPELSVFSLSEIAIKSTLGKLTFSMEETFRAIADLELRILPYTAEHARYLFELPLHHTDPFDRHIVAQALAEGIPVVTSDEAFNLYKGVKVIW